MKNFKVCLKTKILAFFLSFVLLMSSAGQFVFAEEMKDTTVVNNVIPGNLYIPAKTTFEVSLTKELHSKHNKKGETVDFEMVDNLIINGIVIIPKGTIGRAILTEARKSGMFGRKGKLTLTAQWIKTINNVQIPLTNNEFKNVGKSDGGAIAVAAVVSVVGGAFMKGTSAIYPEGTKFTIEIENNVDLGATEEELASIDENKVRGQEIRVNVTPKKKTYNSKK